MEQQRGSSEAHQESNRPNQFIVQRSIRGASDISGSLLPAKPQDSLRTKMAISDQGMVIAISCLELVQRYQLHGSLIMPAATGRTSTLGVFLAGGASRRSLVTCFLGYSPRHNETSEPDRHGHQLCTVQLSCSVHPNFSYDSANWKPLESSGISGYHCTTPCRFQKINKRTTQIVTDTASHINVSISYRPASCLLLPKKSRS
jgi:hypothetical protein